MTSSKKLVSDFVRKSGMGYKGSTAKINLPDIVGYLNEAQEILFRNMVRLSETNPHVKSDLRRFEIKCHCVECTDKDTKTCVSELPDNFYQRINQKARTCNTKCCGDLEKEIIIRIAQGDDVNESRQNPFRKSDFGYEQLLGEEGSEGFYVYHEGLMEVKEVCIDYYRKPKEIHAPSLAENCDDNGKYYYDYCGRIIDKDQDLELECRYLDISIVNLAVALYQLANKTLNYQAYQQTLQSMLTINNII